MYSSNKNDTELLSVRFIYIIIVREIPHCNHASGEHTYNRRKNMFSIWLEIIIFSVDKTLKNLKILDFQVGAKYIV